MLVQAVVGQWRMTNKKEGLTLSIVPVTLLVIAPPVVDIVGGGAGAGSGASVENDKKKKDLPHPSSPLPSL